MLGNTPFTALRTTALYFGGVLVYKGRMYSFGLMRDKYKCNCIPEDKFEYFAKKSPSDDGRLYPHIAAIITGLALITFVGMNS